MANYLQWFKKFTAVSSLLIAGVFPVTAAAQHRGGGGHGGGGGGRGGPAGVSRGGGDGQRSGGNVSRGSNDGQRVERSARTTRQSDPGAISSSRDRLRSDGRRNADSSIATDRNWRSDHDHHDGHHDGHHHDGHHDHDNFGFFVGLGLPWFGYSPFYSYGYGYGYDPYYYGYDPYFTYGYDGVREPGYVTSRSYYPDTADNVVRSSRRDSQADTTAFERRGEDAFRAGNYRAAVREWRHALVDDPRNGTLMMMLAQALFATGEYDEAAGAVQRAMSILPEDRWGTVIANYRDLYGNTQDYVNQLKGLEQAVRNDPKDPALRFLVAFQYGNLGYPRDAVRELDQATKLAPDDRMSASLRDAMMDRTTRR